MLVRADNYLVVRKECKQDWLELPDVVKTLFSNNINDWITNWLTRKDYKISEVLKQKLIKYIEEVNYEVSN